MGLRIVHRPYTQRGDIFLNLRPDQLEIVNPGRLPLGVTPKNILHASRRRNDGLARIFHDIGLMEREGSGFDLMYDRLLATGRGAPVATEGVDSVHITILRRVIDPAVIRLIGDANKNFQLTQRRDCGLDPEVPRPARHIGSAPRAVRPANTHGLGLFRLAGRCSP